MGSAFSESSTPATRTPPLPAQAANFARYSSHWHVLSPHRTVDVADVAAWTNTQRDMAVTCDMAVTSPPLPHQTMRS